MAARAFDGVRGVFPKFVTSTDRLGQAMLRAARTGFATHIVENAELR